MKISKLLLTIIISTLALPALALPAHAGSCWCTNNTTVVNGGAIGLLPSGNTEIKKTCYYSNTFNKQDDCVAKGKDLSSFFMGVKTTCNYLDGQCELRCGSSNLVCTKIDKSCTKDEDCTQNVGGAKCFEETCYLDPAALNAFNNRPSVLWMDVDLKIKNPATRIVIPGLTFTDVSSTLDNNGNIYLPFLGEFTSAVYKFIVAISTIVAAIMIIMGGTRIIISAGGEEKSAGYKNIGNAIVGLVLVWGSYFILYTINPDLVNFKVIKVQYVEPIIVDSEGEPDINNPAQDKETVIDTPNFNNCHLEKYPDFANNRQTFGAVSGECKKWARLSWAEACNNNIPNALTANGAWDVAKIFWKNNKFHSCNFDGIKNGDLVFMTSLGSNYIGLWQNFRLDETLGCTIADSAETPTYYNSKTGNIERYKSQTDSVTGMPPVTHVGVYFNGNVYHLLSSIEATPITPIKKATDQTTTKKKIWTDYKVMLTGGFIDNTEFIAGYGTWGAAGTDDEATTVN